MENYNKTISPINLFSISKDTISMLFMILFSVLCIVLFLATFKSYYTESHTYHLTREYDESITPEEEDAIKAVDAARANAYN